MNRRFETDNSHNTSWDFEEFGEDDGLRAGQWGYALGTPMGGDIFTVAIRPRAPIRGLTPGIRVSGLQSRCL